MPSPDIIPEDEAAETQEGRGTALLLPTVEADERNRIMEMFSLLFTAAEAALVALGIATITVVAIGGLIVGTASFAGNRRRAR
ncbi:hypothetical protein [Agrococcus sp. ARC_14]|nr:hypothetical protein [Agrococcus sp. ARC_14]MCH1881780.1 hypothetical protein [Agrococcus sp. ARC_14]